MRMFQKTGRGSVVLRLGAMAAAVWFAAAAHRAAGQTEGAEQNLVANPSFELAGTDAARPRDWQGNPQVYAIDASVAKTGQRSLKYSNADPQRYVLCTQRVPLQAGWKCRVRAWVKTEALVGDESGATICLEWQDERGKWLGGVYPSGIKGTRDWQRIEAITRLPPEAATCNLACYVRQGMTGTAWFDDLELVRLTEPPMQSLVRSPVYRGQLTADGPEEIRVRARLNLADFDLSSAQVQLQAQLRRVPGTEVLDECLAQPDPQSPDALDAVLPAGDLLPGRYEVTLRLTGPAGEELQVARHSLVRLPEERQPKCWIDNHRRLWVDGQPFLPLGMYWSSIDEQDLQIYADSKFNCLMPYGSPSRSQMDLAERYGLKVIYSVKDWYAGLASCPRFIRNEADEEQHVRARVREFRDHPALLAWYLNDELPQSYLPRLEAHQQWVAEEDFDHPTWVVLYQFREVAAYRNTFDVIGTDPYPIGRAPASQAAAWTAETFRQVEQARPMWQVPQLHNWANYAKSEPERQRGRTPTVDEVRSMAWQCLCEGATGLVFYSWYDVKRNPDVSFEDQWAGLKDVAAEIDRMAPILLSVAPAPPVRIIGPQPPWLHWLVRMHAGKLYVVAVNNGDGSGRVRFRLPQPPRQVQLVGERRALPVSGSEFDDDFPPLAVRVFEIEL